MATPNPRTPKEYRCTACGHISIQTTNHYGKTWSVGHFNCCAACPPFRKYPEFGGQTVWECVAKDYPPEYEEVPYKDFITRAAQLGKSFYTESAALLEDHPSIPDLVLRTYTGHTCMEDIPVFQQVKDWGRICYTAAGKRCFILRPAQ